MQIIDKFLPPTEYNARVYRKTNIVLHHTVSSNAQSPLTWWSQSPETVAAAFVIDKDGSIYRAFPEEMWAHHLGLKTANNLTLNRRSIAIELVNEGFTWTVPQDKDLHWFCKYDIHGKPGPIYRGPVTKKAWRNGLWWPDYPEAQLYSCFWLVADLLRRYTSIAPTIAPPLIFDPSTPNKYGIYSHHHVRIDKTDLSPAFPWQRLAKDRIENM